MSWKQPQIQCTVCNLNWIMYLLVFMPFLFILKSTALWQAREDLQNLKLCAERDERSNFCCTRMLRKMSFRKCDPWKSLRELQKLAQFFSKRNDIKKTKSARHFYCSDGVLPKEKKKREMVTGVFWPTTHQAQKPKIYDAQKSIFSASQIHFQ